MGVHSVVTLNRCLNSLERCPDDLALRLDEIAIHHRPLIGVLRHELFQEENATNVEVLRADELLQSRLAVIARLEDDEHVLLAYSQKSAPQQNSPREK